VRAFAGRVALVTGAGSGIGLALSRALVEAGALVVLSDLDAARVQAEARALGPAASALALDVTDPSAFEGAVDRVVEERGRLDLLFNNAGVGLAGEVRDTTLADWRRQLDVNLWGVIHGVHAAYPRFVEQGSGHIVNVASGAGLLPRPGMVAYAAAKHAVVGLSTSLRAEARGLGVRVTAVCPGYIETGIMDRTRYAGLDAASLRASIPIRPTSAARCAQVVLRGVARDRALVTVTALTRAEWWLHRLLPGVAQRFAEWRGGQIRAHRNVDPQRRLPCPQA
jgi:NAD(P)-dependent dehydrogenase (short-subunit alcohol dehydrogenase family)